MASIAGLKDLIGLAKASIYFDDLLKSMSMCLADPDDDVRKSSIELMSQMLAKVDQAVLESFSRTLSALCANLLSHISWGVKLDGLKMIGAVLARMPHDAHFTERTQTSLVHLLASTKRKELRNQILLIFRKLMRADESDQADNVTFDFDDERLAPLLCTRVNTIARQLQVHGASGVTAFGAEPKVIWEALKPAIEQAWIENCAGRIGKDELTLFIGMIELIEHQVQLEVNLHNWLRVRLASPFPVQLKTSVAIRIQVNVRLAEVYLKSFDVRFVKKQPDQTEFKVLRQINEFIIDMLKDEKHLEPELRRLLLSLACSLDLRLARFKQLDETALHYALNVYLGKKELNGARRVMLFELFDQLEHEVVCQYLKQNLAEFTVQLFEQHEEAYAKLNMTVAMSLEESLAACIRAVNHLMRTSDFQIQLPYEKLAQVFLMDSQVQTAFVNVLYLLPRGQVQLELNKQLDTIVNHWCSELLDAKTLIRLVYLLAADTNFVPFARSVLLRQSETDTNDYEPVHAALARFLCKFERPLIDGMLDIEWGEVSNDEQCSAITTINKVVLGMDSGDLTANVRRAALAILFSPNEKYRTLVEHDFGERNLLFSCLQSKW